METLIEKIAKYVSLVIVITSAVFIIYLGEVIIGYVMMFSGALLLYLTMPSVTKKLLIGYSIIALLCGCYVLL